MAAAFQFGIVSLGRFLGVVLIRAKFVVVDLAVDEAGFFGQADENLDGESQQDGEADPWHGFAEEVQEHRFYISQSLGMSSGGGGKKAGRKRDDGRGRGRGI